MANSGVVLGVVALLLTVFGCQSTDLESEEAIRDLIADYAESVNEVDDVLILVAWDAVLMPEDSPARVGQQAIRSFFETRSSQTSIQMGMNPIDIIVRDGWAVAHTEDSWLVTQKTGGAADSFDTKSLVVLRQNDYGEWRIAGLMWNRDE
jgi:ketosteroid isomerase-like protein